MMVTYAPASPIPSGPLTMPDIVAGGCAVGSPTANGESESVVPQMVVLAVSTGRLVMSVQMPFL